MRHTTGNHHDGRKTWRQAFFRDRMAASGFFIVALLLVIALLAPLLVNGRPLLLIDAYGTIQFPFLRNFFAPQGNETLIEKFFNFLLIYTALCAASCRWWKNQSGKRKVAVLGVLAILSMLPFFLVKGKLEKINWHDPESTRNCFVLFAPVSYGPFASTAEGYDPPGAKHWLGTDSIGRDVLARMVYGTRISLAVGMFSTLIALIIGTVSGLFAGYCGGRVDMLLMRIIEVMMCIPTFLLLLILMSVFSDLKINQSILLIILIIGFTSWTGLCRLVRGETLKIRNLPYIKSCEVAGLPLWRIMIFHLLPNIVGMILVSFSFAVAGAILAESGLSFLGFGVQPPTPSWGALLRQAFSDPFNYWHLTLFPGLALFVTVCAFNFCGEGLRKIFDPHS